MINVQIAIEEELLADIAEASKPQPLDLPAIVREALHAWLKRREGLRFEQEWIAALQKHPDEAQRAEDWLEAQAWSES